MRWSSLSVLRPAGPRGLRLLSTFDLGEPPDNGQFGDCCGEDCPFQPVGHAPGLVSVALAPVARHANLDCRRAHHPPPWLSPGTSALRSSDFPRAMKNHCPRPSVRPLYSLVNVRTAPKGHRSRCRRGDLNSHGFPHYALNVARLPIPPLRPIVAIRFFNGWSRPGDSNPRPALYERAALPTELGRLAHLHDLRFYQSGT